MLDPVTFFKSLGDDTRLKCILLIHEKEELCVCNLEESLQLSQPKISRHLALLRQCQLLQATRKEQWMYYSLSPELPKWAREIISETAKSNHSLIKDALERLKDIP